MDEADRLPTRRSILALAAALVPSVAFAARQPARTGVASLPPLLGRSTAPKRFVVWGSYSCPYTAGLMPLLKRLQADMPDRVSVEWRHFPIHPPDPALHIAGLSLGRDKMWPFTFAVLQYLLEHNSPPDDAHLLELVTANGGSRQALNAAYADKGNTAILKRDLVAGQLMGVTRTPGLFVNGYFLTPEGLPFNLKSFDQSLRNMVETG
jgi:protein-disulfide isomerase